MAMSQIRSITFCLFVYYRTVIAIKLSNKSILTSINDTFKNT